MRATLACLLVLAGGQLAASAHQFEHTFDDHAAACETCLQFERSDDAIPVVGSVEQLPVVAGAQSRLIATSVVTPTLTPFRSRAPPITS